MRPGGLPGAHHRPALLLATVALLGAASAAANPVSCNKGGVERSIEVVYTRSGSSVPCEVVYRKPAAAVTDVLWRADHQAGYCEAQADDLLARLRKGGWVCDTDTAAAEPVDLDDALLEPELIDVR